MRLKNTLKSLIRSPGKLLYLIIMIGLIVLTIFSGNSSTKGPDHAFRDIREFNAVVTALYTVMFLIIAAGGFSRGGIFSMADVNLFSGTRKSAKGPFLRAVQADGPFPDGGHIHTVPVFLTHMTYGINYGTLLLVLLGYGFAVFWGR